MLNRILIIIIFSSFPYLTSIKAQEISIIDSLKKELKKASSDSARVLLLSNISSNYWLSNPDSSIKYSTKGLDLAIKINFKEGQGICLYDRSVVHIIQGNYPLALDYNLKALRIYEQIKYKRQIAMCLNGQGNIYCNQKDYSKALITFLKSMTILEQLHDTISYSNATNNIGVIFMELKDYLKALEYFSKSLHISEKARNKYLQCLCLGNIGDLYHRKGNYVLAVEYLKKSLLLAKELQNMEAISNDLQMLADIYLKTGEYNKCITFGKEAIKSAQEIKSLNYLQQAAHTLFEAFQKLSDFQNALKYQLIATEANDSMFSVEKIKTMNDLKNDYEMEKKKKEIQLLEKDKKIAQSRSLFLGIGMFLVLVLIVVVYFNFKKERKAKQLLFEQNNEIERQKKEIEIINAELEQKTIDLLETDKMKSKFFTTISHEFRTPLSLIIGPLSGLMDKTNDKATTEEYILMLKHSKKLLNLINQLLELTKLQSAKIKLSIAYSDVNLFLRTIVSSFSSLAAESKINFIYKIDQTPLFVWFDKDRLEKIVVNLLSNAFKHTPIEGNIIVSLKYETKEPDFLDISVSDNGSGIAPEDIKNIFEPFYQADTGINR